MLVGKHDNVVRVININYYLRLVSEHGLINLYHLARTSKCDRHIKEDGEHTSLNDL